MALDDLNASLDDLAIQVTLSDGDLAQADGTKVVMLASRLITTLTKAATTAGLGALPPLPRPVTPSSVAAWCVGVGCPYPLDQCSTPRSRLLCLTFLAREAQSVNLALAKAMRASATAAVPQTPAFLQEAQPGSDPAQPADSGGLALLAATSQQLCAAMRVPVPDVPLPSAQGDALSKDALAPTHRALAKAFLTLAGRVQALLPALPPGHLTRCTPLLPPALATGPVVDILKRINNGLAADYARRRAMAVKRLNVTLQGFLWGATGTERAGEMQAAVAGRRAALARPLQPLDVAEVFMAGPELLRQAGAKVSSTPPAAAVKGVVMGAVPDRGGRPGEMRPSSSDMMPAWMTRRAGGGGRGGGGGRQRGGAGRGQASKRGRTDKATPAPAPSPSAAAEGGGSGKQGGGGGRGGRRRGRGRRGPKKSS